MDHFDARLRLREVTQELYDIGDEVATYIDNLAEAVADCDVELVDECVAELTDIVDDAVDDAIPLVFELTGLRQAFISGIRRGELAYAAVKEPAVMPEGIDVARLMTVALPHGGPVRLQAVTSALAARTDMVAAHLVELADWLSAENARGVEDLGTVGLPSLYSRSGRRAMEAAAAWRVTVAETHPAVADALRGRRPPAFLGERARAEAVAARVGRSGRR